MSLWTRKKTKDELDIMKQHSRWMTWGVYLLIIYIIFSDMLGNTIDNPPDVKDYTENTSESLGEKSLQTKIETAEHDKRNEEIIKKNSPYYSKIALGNGLVAKCGDIVDISYEIILYDGTVYESKILSVEIGSGSNNIFEQSVDGMKVGGIRQVVLQPRFAEIIGIKNNPTNNTALKINMISIKKTTNLGDRNNCTLGTIWKDSIFNYKNEL